jgi:hypothetical protein
LYLRCLAGREEALGACRTLHRGPATVLEPWDSEISDRSCGELSQLLRPLLRLP